MFADSQQRWRCVEAVPALEFHIDGTSAVRAREPSQRGWLTVAEGLVTEVHDRELVVGGDVSVFHSLPACISLRPLLGTRVKVALSDEPSVSGPRAQTLVLTQLGGRVARVSLVARYGSAGRVHSLGRSLELRTALSQRPGGPMTFGTARLQYVLHVGRHARVASPEGEHVIHFEARTAFDYVAYAIAERSLWVSAKHLGT